MYKPIFLLSVALLFIVSIPVFSQNTALYFNNNQFVTISASGAASPFNFISGDFSLETWIMPDQFPAGINSNDLTIMGNNNDISGSGYVLSTGGSAALRFAYNYGGGWHEVKTAPGAIEKNKWQHIAVTKSGGNIKLYIDGQVVASVIFNTNVNILSSAEPFRIGETGSQTSKLFTGLIDEVKIWNVVRTQQQVRDDGKEVCSSYPTALLAYYKLNESSPATTVACVTNAVYNGTCNQTVQSRRGALLFPADFNTLYVDPPSAAMDCGGAQGYSWQYPLPDLDTALALAFQHQRIKSVYVAKGVYHPSRLLYERDSNGTFHPTQVYTQNTARTFHVRPDLSLYGGFPTGGGVANPALHQTILDGSNAGGVLSDTANVLVYMRGYYPGQPLPKDTMILSGFTLRNQKMVKGQLAPGGDTSGSAVYCVKGTIKIEKCNFNNLQPLVGGAAITSNGNYLEIDSCNFNNNLHHPNFGSATYNSGVFFIHNSKFNMARITSGPYATSVIENNEMTGAGVLLSGFGFHTVRNNYMHSIGHHVIYADKTSSCLVVGNNITNNTGCGIYAYRVDGLYIDSNTISHNISQVDGGGINANYSSGRIANNSIVSNQGLTGGGIYCAALMKICNNFISENRALEFGGLFTIGDTVLNNMIIGNTATRNVGAGRISSGTPFVCNNVIANNKAPWGGGLWISQWNGLVIMNNTFYNNVATDSTLITFYGINFGGMLLDGKYGFAATNIFYKNKIGASDTVDFADFHSGQLQDFYYNLLQMREGRYRSIGWPGPDIGIDGANNIFGLDPVFANEKNVLGLDNKMATTDDGLQLSPASPVLDKGGYTINQLPFIVDITGATRIAGVGLDLGAYELDCRPANLSDRAGVCPGGSLLVKINSSAASQDISWYTDSSSTSPFHMGYTLSTPALQQTDTYWVAVAGCMANEKVPIVVMVDTPLINVVQQGMLLRAQQGNDSYQWLTCSPYNIIQGATSDSLPVSANGEYCVVVENGNCVDTSICVTVLGISIHQPQLNKLMNVYPNPTKGVVNIEFSEYIKNVQCTLKNTLGQIVWTKTMLSGKVLTLDLGSCINGLFLLEISGDNINQVIRISKY